MADTDKKFLEGLTAHELLKHAYPETLEKLVWDLQAQINDSQSWKENSLKEGHKLSDKEIWDLDNEIIQKTAYVKSLLDFYASYNHPDDKMQDLCRYYGIKTFRDNLLGQKK